MSYYEGSETLTYAILGSGAGLVVLFCIVQNNMTWFRNCCRSIGCECCLSATVAPEETLARKPTSAEYIYAMAELLQSVETQASPHPSPNVIQ